MNQDQICHLVTMVNQIAANLGHGASDMERAEQVAAHLRKFWAPSMRKQLVDYASSDGSDLSAVAMEAVGKLQGEQSLPDAVRD